MGANNWINKLELKYINTAKPINNIESFMLTWVKTIPPFFLLRGVRTATTALCKGPLIPPMIISKKPGII